ncbi:unnamed protein product [Prorocentrum cordatum]|uniref:Uncharacterized protein n=1 Tax=Prorocentrum cordatum TaxID=2364126 RepID=A0ABN9PVT8_9DINO|nr:unnamed protein product [Polarella glacialis]
MHRRPRARTPPPTSAGPPPSRGGGPRRARRPEEQGGRLSREARARGCAGTGGSESEAGPEGEGEADDVCEAVGQGGWDCARRRARLLAASRVAPVRGPRRSCCAM